MYLPPIESNCNYEPFVSGDVSIAPDAAIAPGVIIQAGPDGTLVIASGVCIGMGAILHAYEGAIEIEEGVTIGAGVLVVGQAKIGARACIGALTTVVNSDLQAEETVAAGSILGDRSRQLSETEAGVCTPNNQAEGTVCGVGGRTGATGAIETEEQSEYLAPATRGNTSPQPKPISIPEAASPVIEFELETTAPDNNTEEEPETTEGKFQYPSSGTGYATSIQPKPISIPETGTPVTNLEEATAPSNAEEEPETTEGKFQYPFSGSGFATSIQPKAISIPETGTPVTNLEETTAPSNTEEEPETTEGKFQYPSSGTGYATSIQPKPISIPETGTPVTNLEEEATTPSNAEEEPETTEGKFQYPFSGSGFATSIQPKAISIPETGTPAPNLEEEATTPSNAEEAAGTPAPNFPEEEPETPEVKFQYPSPGTGFATSIQPKPISIPETGTANNGAIVPGAETEASESEEEEKPQAAKPPVAGLDYVQSMMKTLFPHKNISLSSQDDED
ncbi:MAG: hypothetical protein SXA11_13945 [Cyanobacteriota bacterium]|nr:hypothetical protein [Cyanobacteriota bacterium]